MVNEHLHPPASSATTRQAETIIRRIDSPIGNIWLSCCQGALTRISFAPLSEHGDASSLLCEAERQLAAYFAGALHTFKLPLEPEGTLFQRRVWQEVTSIHFGSTLTYREIADRLGGSSARAVGHANAMNPLPIVVPCHRVLGSDGRLTGYLGGLERKRWLLRHEGALAHDLFSPS